MRRFLRKLVDRIGGEDNKLDLPLPDIGGVIIVMGLVILLIFVALIITGLFLIF